jgi:hypothetical protein
MIFGWLVCKVKGKHSRGKAKEDRMSDDKSLTRTYFCQRCGATWERKIRAAA